MAWKIPIALTLLAVLAVLAVTAGCGRATAASDWTADDTQRAAAALTDSLLASRWHQALGEARPAIAFGDLEASTGEDDVDLAIVRNEVERRLVSAGLLVVDDAGKAELTLGGGIRRASDDAGDWLYVMDLRLVELATDRVVWVDTVQVRKPRTARATANRGRGKQAPAHDRKQPGDRMGSFPGNDATNRTVNLHVTRAELSETELIEELAALRRIAGVQSIQEQMDERGTARLLIYVLPHRELEVRKRLAERGWEPIRY